jgi:quinol monooxygenase YgiN
VLIVTAVNKLRPGRKQDFIDAAREVILATRAEPGNLRYQLFASTENEDELMYYEEWRDQAALDAHMRSPHILAWFKGKERDGFTSGPSQVTITEAPDRLDPVR